MKLNEKELLYIGNKVNGEAHKEGALWIKETEKKLKKKEVYTRRYFRLVGNLLFYLSGDNKSDSVYGLIILIKTEVEPECQRSETQHAFKITFQYDSSVYNLAAESPEEMVSWIMAIRSVNYDFMLTALSELRTKIFQLAGRDPIPAGNPYYKLPYRSMDELPLTTGTTNQYEPILNLSLACSSLVSLCSNSQPSAFVITNIKTPPQFYWLRHSQTEVLPDTCDPHYFTTVILTAKYTLLSTEIKFEVFDVYDRKHQKMLPIGTAECTVKDILGAPNYQLRKEIKQGGDIRGYINILGWKEALEPPMQTPENSSPKLPLSPLQVGFDGWRLENVERSKSKPLKLPFNKLLMTTFQFPIAKSSKEDVPKVMKVSEVMGEGLYSWSIPTQLMKLFIKEDNIWLQYYHSLGELVEEWEMIRQEVVLDHFTSITHYREVLVEMEKLQGEGITFKKSTDKSQTPYEFIPTNLHIQYMRVELEKQSSPTITYEVISVGAPTAYNLKFKTGGLMKWHNTAPFSMANHYLDNAASDNKTLRGKIILEKIEEVTENIKLCFEAFTMSSSSSDLGNINEKFYNLQTEVYRLQSHCNINLMNEALEGLQKAMSPKARGPLFGQHCTTVSLLFDHIESALSTLGGHVTGLDQIDFDGTTSPARSKVNWKQILKDPSHTFFKYLEDVVSILKKAVYYIFLKDAFDLAYERVPLGIQGYRHRRDICFSHAVTTLATSFATKLRQCAVDPSYSLQLAQLGFLVYWESLLSTHGDESGMLEDFFVAVQDLNNVKLKITCGDGQHGPIITGARYKVTVEMPLEDTLFRLLPIELQKGQEISVCAVMFSQGINEQQSIADRIGDNSLQDAINIENFRTLKQYLSQLSSHFALAGEESKKKVALALTLAEELQNHVHNTRKRKNIEIFATMQALSRLLNAARVTSCKSAKDRTAMAVTLEQVQILIKDFNMAPSAFQQALDSMRSQGTRIHNSLKNVGHPQYAFNVIQIPALPRHYRPPEGTYRKLPT